MRGKMFLQSHAITKYIVAIMKVMTRYQMCLPSKETVCSEIIL